MAVSSVDIGVDTEIIQPRKNIFSVAKGILVNMKPMC